MDERKTLVEAVRKYWASKTPQERKEIMTLRGKLGGKASWDNLTEEQQRERIIRLNKARVKKYGL